MRFRYVILMITCSMCFRGNVFALDFDPPEVHGFYSAGFMKSTHNNYLTESTKGSFEYNEFGININTVMTDNMRIGAQIYSFDLGNIGNNNVKLDWAFLDYRQFEWFNIKVGKIKTPINLYNEIQDYDLLRTPILLPQSVYNVYFRETFISTQGFDIYGKIRLGLLGSLQYDIFAGTEELEDDGGMSKFFSQYNLNYKSARVNNAMGGRLKWYTPIQGLMFSASGFNADLDVDVTINVTYIPASDTNPNATMVLYDTDLFMPELQLTFYSMEYTYSNLTLSAELMTIYSNNTVPLPDGTNRHPNTRMEGYYGMASYRFNSWLEISTYYSVFTVSTKDRSGRYEPPGYAYYNWQKDGALTFRFDINDFWIFKLEGHLIDGVGLAATDNPPVIDDAAVIADSTGNPIAPGVNNRKWEMITLKTTFSF